MFFNVDDLIEVHFVSYLCIVGLISARKVERITQFSTLSWLSFVNQSCASSGDGVLRMDNQSLAEKIWW